MFVNFTWSTSRLPNHTYNFLFFLTLYMDRAAIPEHPFEVLCYAAKHGYADLLDSAEKRAMGMTLEKAYTQLTPALYVEWVKSIVFIFLRHY
jgi:hypothetical protein